MIEARKKIYTNMELVKIYKELKENMDKIIDEAEHELKTLQSGL